MTLRIANKLYVLTVEFGWCVIDDALFCVRVFDRWIVIGDKVTLE